jgi:hypothetical protein
MLGVGDVVGQGETKMDDDKSIDPLIKAVADGEIDPEMALALLQLEVPDDIRETFGKMQDRLIRLAQQQGPGALLVQFTESEIDAMAWMEERVPGAWSWLESRKQQLS